MKHLTKMLFVLCWGIFLASCNKDDGSGTIVDTPTEPGLSIFKGKKVTMKTLRGTVTNEKGEPLAGAMAMAGGKTVTTDGSGLFVLENVSMPENHGFVSITKDGYFSGSRSFAMNTQGTDVTVSMLPRVKVASFSSTQGAMVKLKSGDEMFFGPNSIKVDG
ncbi:MAG: carboxypeptidase-like regulatory domain-containing protein, partial [Flavobacteriaceae bacterium]|nr:carboxypeptidase-like regulatory domain-containing protein [Flavobacteriaceae bacterium]